MSKRIKQSAPAKKEWYYIVKTIGLKIAKPNQYLDIDDIEDNVEKLLRYSFELDARGKILVAVSKTLNNPTKWFEFTEKFLEEEFDERRSIIINILDLFHAMYRIKNSDERGEYMEAMWNRIEPDLHKL